MTFFLFMTLTLGKSKWPRCLLLILHFLSIVEKRTEIADGNWLYIMINEWHTEFWKVYSWDSWVKVIWIMNLNCLYNFKNVLSLMNFVAWRDILRSWIWIQFSSIQSLSRVWLFATPWTTARQASLSITSSLSLLKLMFIELVMPSNHLILCCPLLLQK